MFPLIFINTLIVWLGVIFEAQDVTYVTERAVFHLTPKGIELLEYAPGIDIQKDILDLIPFPVLVSNPKEMDAALFT